MKFTIADAAGKRTDFAFDADTLFIGPRGGQGEKDGKDDRFVVGAPVKIVVGANGKAVKEVHLPVRSAIQKKFVAVVERGAFMQIHLTFTSFPNSVWERTPRNSVSRSFGCAKRTTSKNDDALSRCGRSHDRSQRLRAYCFKHSRLGYVAHLSRWGRSLDRATASG